MYDNIFRMPAEDTLTAERLQKFITANEKITKTRWKPLYQAYDGSYRVQKRQKPAWKPNNKLTANFASYLVSTFEGFFMGIPVKTNADDDTVADYVNEFESENAVDDQNAELSTLVSIFGRAYEMYYEDENAEIRTAYLSPMEAFIIYDDSIKPKPLYFVRYFTDYGEKPVKRGSVSNADCVDWFVLDPTLRFTEERPHGFAYVPAVEYTANASRKGLFEDAVSLIEAYCEAISDKSNDVSYFADAYMKIFGVPMDEETIQYIRDSRIIWGEGQDGKNPDVGFLEKPDGDATQEHLLDRLERLIFSTTGVCNISDDNFATSSGIALKYKLLPMINLAKRKERKFQQALADRYRIIFSHPLCPIDEEEWSSLRFTFYQNIPANLSDEADIAGKLQGITSNETALSVLSIVDDVKAEQERIRAEEAEELTDYETSRTTEADETADED